MRALRGSNRQELWNGNLHDLLAAIHDNLHIGSQFALVQALASNDAVPARARLLECCHEPSTPLLPAGLAIAHSHCCALRKASHKLRY